MKPPEKKWPQAKHAGQQPQRPATPASPFKPAVAQTKSAAPARPARHPSAPPNHASQATPRVLQRKAAQPPPKTPPVRPPAYGPQPAPKAAQTKNIQAPVGVGAAAKRPPASEVKGPVPTPAYRPQSAPRCLQLKGAGGRKPQAAQPDDKRQAPSASRRQPSKPAPPKSSPATRAGGVGVLQRMRWKFLGDNSWEPQDAFPEGAAIPPPPPRTEDNPVLAHVRINDIYDDKNNILRNAAGKMVLLKGGPDGKRVRADDAPPPVAVAKTKAQPKKSGAGEKKAEVKEVRPPLPPVLNFIKGLQSVSYMYKNMTWKQVEDGTPGSEHAEVGLWNNIAKEKKWEGRAWIGFVQNGAPCGVCYKFFRDESKRRESKVAGFVFQVTADQGGYRSEPVYEHVRAKKTFGIYFIGGVATLL